MKLTNNQRERFESKYGKDLLTEVSNKIKGKPLSINQENNIIVDEDRSSEPNEVGKKGRAYAYLDGFTRELVIDFLEYDKKDSLGYNELKLVGFKEYKVVF